MLLAEEFFRLADFGALQVADLGGDLVEGGCDHRERRQVVRVPIALNHLRGDVGRFQSQPRADFLLEFRGKVREGANCAGELSHPQAFSGVAKARNVALRFRVPICQLESEGNGFGVHAVGAANLRRVLEFPGAALEHFGKALQIFGDDVGGLPDQQRLRRVYHVVGSQAVVEPARVRADDLGDRGGEGNDVVPDLGLDLLNALEFEAGALANGLGGLFGDKAGFGQSLGGGDLDRQPVAKPVLFAPDAPHRRGGYSAGSQAVSQSGEI